MTLGSNVPMSEVSDKIAKSSINRVLIAGSHPTQDPSNAVTALSWGVQVVWESSKFVIQSYCIPFVMPNTTPRFNNIKHDLQRLT